MIALLAFLIAALSAVVGYQFRLIWRLEDDCHALKRWRHEIDSKLAGPAPR